ncbi:hypothetical protein B4U80_03998 [Leptotrombidium deliense]|uniref:Transmembrane protein 230 n=1 Tax=Leptotrombidium deliense TaxID=299467 RepID=A0A443SIY7_9ACAR|nr:hypothetical protein B4U80_03998 [Leptotrombidium deliense]
MIRKVVNKELLKNIKNIVRIEQTQNVPLNENFGDETNTFSSDSESKSRFNSKYRRFANNYDDYGYFDKQFERPTPKIPWKAIILALFLFIAGINAISFSLLSLLGNIENRMNEGTLVLLILGFFMFIPGYYHVMIAYYAFKRYPGYSFDDIPDFD